MPLPSHRRRRREESLISYFTGNSETHVAPCIPGAPPPSNHLAHLTCVTCFDPHVALYGFTFYVSPESFRIGVNLTGSDFELSGRNPALTLQNQCILVFEKPVKLFALFDTQGVG